MKMTPVRRNLRERRRGRPGPGIKARPRSAADEVPPAVLLLGSGPRVERVGELLRSLELRCRVAAAPKTVLKHIDDEIRLVVIAPPLPDLSVEDLCRKLRRRKGDSELPILVIGSPPRQAGTLYRAGATGLFEWPGGRTAFIRTVFRLVGLGTPRRRRNTRDVALAARVEERLRAERDTFGPLVSAFVKRGVVFLGGEVNAAWKVSELGRTVASMPGVEEVVTTGIRVPHRGIPDRNVSIAVRRMLKMTSGLEDRTFGIRVSNGQVTLTGTAQSRREMNRVIGLIEQIAGVRGIENLCVVSRRAKHRDRNLARLLDRLIHSQFPQSRIDVSVFGKIAVLNGKARNPTERRAVETLVGNQPDVDRVVNNVG